MERRSRPRRGLATLALVLAGALVSELLRREV
jgi:hypothetical protein